MKFVLFALMSVLSFCLADPLFGFWPGLFAAFVFYLWANEEISSLKRFKYAAGFSYSFLFYLLIKIFTLRGIYDGFINLYASGPKGLISFVSFLGIESVVPGLAGILLQFLFKYKERGEFPYAILLVLAFTNKFSYIWLPQGVEIPLAQNQLLLSSVGIIHISGLIFWCFAISVLIYKRSRLLLGCLFFVPFIIGYARQILIQKSEVMFYPITLIQTNQSELAGKIAPLDWDAITLGFKDKKTIFLPEYTAHLKNPYWDLFLENLRKTNKDFNLYLGIEDSGPEGIKNEIWQLDSQDVLGKFSKRISFPIGESEIFIPFLPRSWLRPKVSIQSSGHSDILKLNDIQIIPLICYEAAMSSHYQNVLAMTDKNFPSIFVNFSKDSHLQDSSALDWLDYFVRLKASELGKTTVRVSTNSYTEVILPWGEVPIRSEKNKFQVIETHFPLYQKTYSLWAN